MLMSAIQSDYVYAVVPEIQGARVLITGLTSNFGFDIARSFADQGAHLVVQSPEDGPEITELGAVLAETSSDIRFFNAPLSADDDARKLVQAAVQDFGGVDTVVNLVTVSADQVRSLETADDVEALISQVLRQAMRVTEIAANRMRLVWTEGAILNVVRVQDTSGGRAMMFADMLKCELAHLTRGLAQEWAANGIRINAVAPPSSVAAMAGDVQATDADLATVAMQLSSREGQNVSGHVLDAAGAARRWC